MASDYPGGLDSFDTIASDKKTSDAVGGRTHRAMHNDLGDAIEAVQAELGTDPAGGSATVKARFDVIEANDWVTAARIAADAVGASEIAAGAVGTAEIADSAVTSAKIADGTIATADLADAAVTPAKLATTGRFTFPTGAANGYGFTSGASHLSGTGTPEGVVTAAPGSTWLQTDSTTTASGWLRWIKNTGTGNTGWVAGPEADTGWRNVATDASGLTGSSITAQIRRTGATVAYRLSFAQSGAASGVTVVSAAGFRGTAPTTYVPIYGNNAGAVVGAAEVGSATVKVYTTASGNGGTVSADVMYSTADTWPSSLPGTA